MSVTNCATRKCLQNVLMVVKEVKEMLGGKRNVIISFPPCFLDLRAARKYEAAVFIHDQDSPCTQTLD